MQGQAGGIFIYDLQSGIGGLELCVEKERRFELWVTKRKTRWKRGIILAGEVRFGQVGPWVLDGWLLFCLLYGFYTRPVF